MDPPPIPEEFIKAGPNPSNCAAQSMTSASNSVQAGLDVHYLKLSAFFAASYVDRRRTLKPGLQALVAYISAMIPSNVQAVGK